MAKHNSEKLGVERIPNLLFSMCTQTTLSLMLYSFYTLSDTFFLSRCVSAYAAGGVSLTLPIMALLGAISTTMGTGGASIISRALGKNDKEKAAHVAANLFLVFWVSALLFTVFGLIFLDPIMRLMGADEILMPYAKGYMRIIFIGAVTSTGFSSIIRAEGNARFSLYIWVFPVLIHLILDPLFIIVFGWGVEGAAASTVLGQAVSAGISIYYFFFSKRDAYKIRLSHFKPRLKLIGEIVSIGSPSLISQVGMSFFTTIINHMLLRYGGAMAITAFGIVARIQGFLVIPKNGIVQGMQPIVGYNYAAGAFDRVKKTIKYSFSASVVYGALTLAIGMIFARPLVGIFITEQDVSALAVSALTLITLSFPFKGTSTIVSAVYQAEGKPFRSVALSMCEIFAVQLPILLLMSTQFLLNGIWLSFVFTDVIMFAISAAIIQKKFQTEEKEGYVYV